MHERGFEARFARSVFYEAFNDIDVYVEDTGREARKLFSKLLEASFGGAIKLECVLPLGGRAAVLEACRSDQSAGGRKRVYLVDGDLDLCDAMPSPELRRFYRLPRYCIENFLIDERAAAIVVARESEELDEVAAGQALRFDEWLTSVSVPLRRLFTAFCTARRLAPGLTTVSLGYSRIVSDASGLIDSLKVEAIITDLKDAIDFRCGRGSFDDTFAKVEFEHRMKGDAEFVLHLVSGKHFLLPLLKLRMNCVVRIAKSPGLLKVNLAESIGACELRDILSVAC